MVNEGGYFFENIQYKKEDELVSIAAVLPPPRLMQSRTWNKE
jgi:hypothetical protein